VARLIISLIALLGVFSAEAAIGCSPAKLTQTASETKAMARKAFQSAQTIADVEVIAVGDDTGNDAVLKALKVWKGMPKEAFSVQVRTSCDIGF
jgi:nicotinic acid phosphoribosyltransferase